MQAEDPDKANGQKADGSKPVAAKRDKASTRRSSRWSRTTRPTTGTTRPAPQIAKMFLDASAQQKSRDEGDFPEAIYNAGLAYQRCNNDAEAKAQFQAALDLDPKFHRARVQLALYDYKEKGDAAHRAGDRASCSRPSATRSSRTSRRSSTWRCSR